MPFDLSVNKITQKVVDESSYNANNYSDKPDFNIVYQLTLQTKRIPWQRSELY